MEERGSSQCVHEYGIDIDRLLAARAADDVKERKKKTVMMTTDAASRGAFAHRVLVGKRWSSAMIAPRTSRRSIIEQNETPVSRTA